MKLARIAMVLMSGVLFAGCATSQPVVLVVGDSISRPEGGYFKPVAEQLGDDYVVLHNPGNAQDSGFTLKRIDQWLDEAQPDIVHLNCGLHDIKKNRETLKNQVGPEQYEANLRAILDRIEAKTDATVIFALTTPVNFEWHRKHKPFDRREEDVERYNKIAVRVMKERGIAINDLHKAIVDANPDECLRPDGVHMNDHGNGQLAYHVVRAISAVK